ncbi:MAG: efflux RND transporter periplasmic adaptor subunit [Bacteroidia bacterium]|nr:efflux RND transporter periplasmic adaptor subunit [Bacteroidia bacterium]
MYRALPLLGLNFFLLVSCSNSDGKIQLQRTQITESVYSSVVIQPDSLYQVHAAVSGILENNLVGEGDTVIEGTPLLQIINTNPKLNTANARLALELARQNLSGSAAVLGSIEDEILAARLKLSDDSVNYYRQKNLWDQEIGSKQAYDSKKLNYQLSRNALSLLNDKYHRTQSELQTQLQQARNNYQTSLTTTRDFTVKSKMHGTVYALFKEPGEAVTTLEPLALVGSGSRFVIEMLVDEVDIVKIETGQQVIVVLDAYNGQVFSGRVSKIYPRKDERNQTFLVEARFDAPPTKLYPGLSGEANIVIATREHVMVIPKDYLVDGQWVLTGEGKVEVRTGLQNLDSIEIITDLEEGTWIERPEE